MTILIQIPENPNCEAVDGLVFSPRGEPRAVTHVRFERGGRASWCAVSGWDDPGVPAPASAAMIDDSGDGACWLLTGGDWGLRLTPEDGAGGQWGEPYLILGGDGADLRFAD